MNDYKRNQLNKLIKLEMEQHERAKEIKHLRELCTDYLEIGETYDNGKAAITKKGGYLTSKLDTTALKIEQPEMYDKYCKIVTIGETIQVTIKK